MDYEGETEPFDWSEMPPALFNSDMFALRSERHTTDGLHHLSRHHVHASQIRQQIRPEYDQTPALEGRISICMCVHVYELLSSCMLCYIAYGNNKLTKWENTVTGAKAFCYSCSTWLFATVFAVTSE